MKRRIRTELAAVVALAVALGATPATADTYRDDEAGHPVRFAAYLLHPVGVVLDYLLFRPAHWLFSHEPLATLVGHED